jgi:ABC-type transport system involved in cytochrome c biogenesis permease subunit
MATTLERRPPIIVKKNQLAPEVLIFHIIGLVMVGLIILVLTGVNFLPVLQSAAIKAPEEKKVAIPDYSYRPWHALLTQHVGRYKPFETACQDVIREIHGRDLRGNDPAVVVLMWMLESNPKATDPKGKWDDIRFIVNEHQELRKLMWRLQRDGTLKEGEPEPEYLHAKYSSPNELTAFQEGIKNLRSADPARFRELFAALEQPYSQVMRRLDLYQKIRQQQMTEEDLRNQYIPFIGLVALDRVEGTPWFSIAELRLVQRDPEAWYEILKSRVQKTPHFYLSPRHHKSLEEFQQHVISGTGPEAVDELSPQLARERDQTVKQYRQLRQAGKDQQAARLLVDVMRTWPVGKDRKESLEKLLRRMPLFQNDFQLLQKFFQADQKTRVEFLIEKQQDVNDDARMLRLVLEDRDTTLQEDLKDQLPAPDDYNPDHPKYLMLHMSYLELAFPNLYRDLVGWQRVPRADINMVLASYEALGEAYRSGDANRFAAATDEFFGTVEQVSQKVAAYPGEDTILGRAGDLVTGSQIHTPGPELISLELLFNHVRPFMWAWILMLCGLLLFILSLALDSRICYLLGFVAFFLSLGFQGFGFFTRVIISGRPPVTNMYETVIWVAFMSSIFALVLELIYRRKVIALAGALVSTITLVLADQLPLALDPKINPLVPVLRSNFWLTIHVLTIVSSYAAATLAWGLGNIALVLIAFGSGKRETIKVLSTFTYRALQIGVILLAIGTFLGGWWAAYSWGRFWGWDPKETGALFALVIYVIPLHMRFIGWIKDFGLAVCSIVCYAAILIAWYGINFVFPSGLHAYGFATGGSQWWVLWAAFINVEWVIGASLIHRYRLSRPALPARAAVEG